MAVWIGFDHYTIGHRRLSAGETLAFAGARGLDGVQFLEPSVIDSGLDHTRLADFRRQADMAGLYLEVGLPSPNPARRSRELGREVRPSDHAADLARHVEAVAALGCRHARAYVGDRHDRFRSDPPWPDQLAATRAVLDALTPRLLDLGLRVAVETHADLTADELLGLLDRLHPEAFGVTLDTGNLAMRLDDPLRAVERLAPRVVCTHVKDCVLARTGRGLCWQARPVGAGALPMADMLDRLVAANPSLNLSIELHPRTYDLPIHDPSWLAYFPSLRPEGLAAVVALADRCEARYAAGALERPEAIEAVPWADRDLDWLDRSRAFLRGWNAGAVPAPSRLV
jgi:sugar phosphate isomerase/epimerase